MNDFLKRAYEKGKIKELSEAFKEFPVEEEWHEGKVENLLKEGSIIYAPYVIGDIVFVKNLAYSNGTQGKNHLFVIVDQEIEEEINNFAVPIENIGMIISSKLDKIKYSSNKLLKNNNKNGLNTDSIVKTDELYRIPNSQILFKIGAADKETVEYYKAEYDNN